MICQVLETNFLVCSYKILISYSFQMLCGALLGLIRSTKYPCGARHAPPRGAGFDIVPERPPGIASRNAQCHTGLPREARSILVLPVQRQAAGAPSAWSQPFNPPPTRPCCSGDAGPLGRQSVTASQKAPVAGAGFHDCSADLKIVIPDQRREHQDQAHANERASPRTLEDSDPRFAWVSRWWPRTGCHLLHCSGVNCRSSS